MELRSIYLFILFTFFLVSSCEKINVSFNKGNIVLETNYVCPQGYILVPGNTFFSTSSFCVMQYEAKAWSDTNLDNIIDPLEIDEDGCGNVSCSTGNWGITNLPVSTADGLPWRKISIENARLRCQALNAAGEKKYDLISRSEWLTIAHNIEELGSNWSGNAVGDGCLSRGNNLSDNICGYTGAGRPEGGLDIRNLKARQVLSNGEFIWDFVGNVWEWNNWKLDFDTLHLAPSCGLETSWTEIPSVIGTCPSVLEEDYLPFNSLNIAGYNSSYGLGKIYISTLGSPLAGGAYNRGSDINGIFAINLDSAPGQTWETSGFRCVFRPWD